MAEKIPAEITNAKEVVYNEKDKVGTGSIGFVYKGQCRGYTVAVKVPNKPKGSSKFPDEFVDLLKEEVNSLSKIYHPRIVLFMGAFVSSKSVLLVNEFLDGDIQEKLKGEISLSQKAVWLKQAAEGMAWLHGANIPHGDLKPSNLLYHNKTNSVKLGDFAMITLKKTVAGNELGDTLSYIAPEISQTLKPTKESDVYSFGLIIYFFVSGKNPNPKEKPTLTEDENVCPKSLREITLSCLNEDPSKRPTFEQIVKNFEVVVVDCSILCEEGRSFWNKNFQSSGNLQAEVTWPSFCRALSAYLQNEVILSSQTMEYNILKKLFLLPSQSTVTLSHFGHILGFFESFSPKEWLQTVTKITSFDWFWGPLSSNDAQKVLSGKTDGYALVRFSSTGSNLTLSYRYDNSLWHTRIFHPYASKSYQLDLKDFSNKFTSLETLIDELIKVKKEKIQKFCDGSPFVDIHNQKKGKILTPSGYAALEYAEDK